MQRFEIETDVDCFENSGTFVFAGESASENGVITHGSSGYLPYGLGYEIRIRRLKRGWSIRTLARRADMDFSNLCEIESGQVTPRSWTVFKIEKALGVELGE